MADYSGYFLKGLGSGLQTGVNLGTQIQEMKWQKKQRKELEEKQAKMTEVSNLWNAKIKEIYTDNKATDEEISQLTTIYLSGGYEFMDHYQGAMNAIKSMNEKAYNQEIEWINLFIETSAGLPSGDIQAAFDIITPYVTSEKGRNTLEAYSNLQKKRTEALQAQPTAEVFTSPKELLEKYPDSGYEYSATAKGYVPTFQKPTTETAKAPTNIEQKIAGIDKLEKAGIITKERANESRAKIYGGVMPEETAAGETKTRTTSLPTLEKYRENALNADTWEDAQSVIKDYTEAGYDVTQLGVTQQDWTNVKKSDLDNLVAVLNEITAGTPEGRNIKGKKKFAFEINGKATEKTGEEWYKEVYESYIALLKLLEKQGVDISQYKKLKPLSEIKKIKFGGFVGAGVETGDLTFIYY